MGEAMNSSTEAKRTGLRRLRTLIASRFSEFVADWGFEKERGGEMDFRFRRKSPQRHDLIEVQFDKYLRPRFILNFGSVPTEGLIDAYGRHIDADDVGIAHLVERGRLNASPKFLMEHWFGLGGLTIGPVERAAEGQVEKLIKLFPQVERWFATGIAGWNFAIMIEPVNAPGVRKKFMEAKGTWPPAGWTEEDQDKLRM
jgi:hypothetical protein